MSDYATPRDAWAAHNPETVPPVEGEAIGPEPVSPEPVRPRRSTYATPRDAWAAHNPETSPNSLEEWKQISQGMIDDKKPESSNYERPGMGLVEYGAKNAWQQMSDVVRNPLGALYRGGKALVTGEPLTGTPTYDKYLEDSIAWEKRHKKPDFRNKEEENLFNSIHANMYFKQVIVPKYEMKIRRQWVDDRERNKMSLSNIRTKQITGDDVKNYFYGRDHEAKELTQVLDSLGFDNTFVNTVLGGSRELANRMSLEPALVWDATVGNIDPLLGGMADKVDDVSAMESGVLNEMSKKSAVGKLGGTVLRGAYSSAAEALLASRVFKSVGMARGLQGAALNQSVQRGVAGVFGTNAGAQAFVRGRQHGLEGLDLAAHTVTQAAIETGVTLAFSGMGRGGFEELLNPVQKAGALRGIKDLLKSKTYADIFKGISKVGKPSLDELAEELSITALSSIEDYRSVDIRALDPAKLRHDFFVTALTTLAMTGPSTAANLASRAHAERVKDARDIAMEDAEAAWDEVMSRGVELPSASTSRFRIAPVLNKSTAQWLVENDPDAAEALSEMPSPSRSNMIDPRKGVGITNLGNTTRDQRLAFVAMVREALVSQAAAEHAAMGAEPEVADRIKEAVANEQAVPNETQVPVEVVDSRDDTGPTDRGERQDEINRVAAFIPIRPTSETGGDTTFNTLEEAQEYAATRTAQGDVPVIVVGKVGNGPRSGQRNYQVLLKSAGPNTTDVGTTKAEHKRRQRENAIRKRIGLPPKTKAEFEAEARGDQVDPAPAAVEAEAPEDANWEDVPGWKYRQAGEFDPSNPPPDTTTEVDPRARMGGNTAAVMTKDGKVWFARNSGSHLGVVQANNLNFDDVIDGGWIRDGKYSAGEMELVITTDTATYNIKELTDKANQKPATTPAPVQPADATPAKPDAKPDAKESKPAPKSNGRKPAPVQPADEAAGTPKHFKLYTGTKEGYDVTEVDRAKAEPGYYEAARLVTRQARDDFVAARRMDPNFEPGVTEYQEGNWTFEVGPDVGGSFPTLLTATLTADESAEETAPKSNGRKEASDARKRAIEKQRERQQREDQEAQSAAAPVSDTPAQIEEKKQAKINNAIEAVETDQGITLTPIKPRNNQERRAQKLAAKLGRTVVFVDHDLSEFRGATVGGVAIVNVRQGRNAFWDTVGHEVAHASGADLAVLDLTDEQKAKLLARYRQQVVDFGDEALLERLDDDPVLAMREATAQFIGDLFSDATLRREYGLQDPTMLGKIVDAIRKVLGNFKLTKAELQALDRMGLLANGKSKGVKPKVAKKPAAPAVGSPTTTAEQPAAEAAPTKRPVRKKPTQTRKQRIQQVQKEFGITLEEAEVAIDLQDEAAPADEAAPSEEEAPATERMVAGGVVEVPTENINVDPGRFQFKTGISQKTGVVEGEELQGEWDQLAGGVILVWEDKAGKQWAVNGHHRTDLAKRRNVPTMTARIVKESDGVTEEHARAMGAKLNILEGQGKVEDYADFFRSTQISEKEATDEGLLARAKGKTGFMVGRFASEDVWAGYRAGKISADKAAAIADVGRGDEGLQAAGLTVAKGKSADELRNFLKALREFGTPAKESQGDLFGFDESSIVEAEKISKAVTSITSALNDRLLAVKGALRRPETAKEMGLSGDFDSIQAEADRIRSDLDRWSKWTTDSELVREARIKAGLDADEGPLFQPGKQRWFTKARNLIAKNMGGKASPAQVLGMLKNNGVKPEELQWSGLEELLGGSTLKKITKEEVLQAIDNGVRVEEVVRPGEPEVDVTFASRTASWEVVRSNPIDELDGAEPGEYHPVIDGERYSGLITVNEDGTAEYRFGGDTRNFQSARELQEWLRNERRETMLHDADGVGTKFAQYQLPGGENYKELLITLPSMAGRDFEVTNDRNGWIIAYEDTGDVISRHPTKEAAKARFDEMYKAMPKDFTDSHFDEPNVVAHIRFNERTGADGKKVLFVEEIQSDLHQQGRKKGYRRPAQHWNASEFVSLEVRQSEHMRGFWTNYAVLPDGREVSIGSQFSSKSDAEQAQETIRKEGWTEEPTGVPDAPFKKTWHMLAMKRVIQYAAENGFDRVAWTTGEQQADRYDLSKLVRSLLYSKNADGTYQLSAQTLDRGGVMLGENIEESELEDHVGKEVAQKIIDGEGRRTEVQGKHNPDSMTSSKEYMQELSGVDLKVGGEGMKAFYDKMLPNDVNKFIKKFGARVGQVDIGTIPRYTVRHNTGRANNQWEVLGPDGSVSARFSTEEAARADAESMFNGPQQNFQPSFDVTPAMRESATSQGQPLYQPPKPSRDDARKKQMAKFVEQAKEAVKAGQTAEEYLKAIHKEETEPPVQVKPKEETEPPVQVKPKEETEPPVQVKPAEPPGFTGIKRERLEMQADAAGTPRPDIAEISSATTLVADAVERLTPESDMKIQAMASDVIDNAKAVSEEEAADLLASLDYHKREADRLDDVSNKHMAAGEKAEAAIAGQESAIHRAKQAHVSQAARDVGRQWHVMGRILQVLVDKDGAAYIERELLKANLGKRDIDANGNDVIAEFAKDMAAKLEAAKKKQAKRGREIAAEEATAAAEDRINQLEGEIRREKTKTRKSTGSRNTVITKAAKDAAVKRILEKIKSFMPGSGRVSMNPVDAATLLPDAAIVAGYVVEAGARKFAAFSKDMITELGDWVKPHLHDLHREARAKLAKARMGTIKKRLEKSKATEGNVRGQFSAVGELAKEILADTRNADGTFITRDELLNKLHKALKKIDPNITKDETRDMFAGYGKWTMLSDEDLEVAYRDRRGESRELSKIEDMKKKRPPKPSGFQQHEPSDEERKLKRITAEMKKIGEREGWYVAGDPAARLKGTLDARITRLKNELSDLQEQIDSKQKTVKKRSKPLTSPELESLQQQVQEKREQLDAIVRAQSGTSAALDAYLKVLDRQIAKLKKDILKKNVFSRGLLPRPGGPLVDARKAEIEALQAEMALLREIIDPGYKIKLRLAAAEKSALRQIVKLEAERDAGFKIKDKPVALDSPALTAVRKKLAAIREERRQALEGEYALLTAIANSKRIAADFASRLARGDFVPRKRAAKKVYNDKAWLDAREEEKKLRMQYAEEQAKYAWDHARLGQKAWFFTKQIGVGWKAWLTGVDLTAQGLQLGISMVMNPIVWSKALLPTIKSMSVRQRKLQDVQMQSDPAWERYMEFGVALREHGKSTDVASTEFYGNAAWLDKIPGAAISERTFSTALNHVRFNLMKVQEWAYTKNGHVLTREQGEALARQVNTFTLAYKPPKNANKRRAILEAAGVAFWAPSMYVARAQLFFLTPLWDLKADSRVRMMAAKQYVKAVVGTVALIAALRMLLGDDDEEELTPIDIDYYKVKVGNIRMDMTSGMGQMYAIAARMLNSAYQARTGEPIWEAKGRPQGTRETLGSFASFKQAPWVSTGFDLTSERDVIGRPTSVANIFLSNITPMSVQTVLEAIDEEGLGKGLAWSVPGVTGRNLSIYDKTAPKSEETFTATLQHLMRSMSGEETPGLTEKEFKIWKTRKLKADSDLSGAFKYLSPAQLERAEVIHKERKRKAKKKAEKAEEAELAAELARQTQGS